MDEKAQKLIHHLQNLIDGIKDESISVNSVSGTIGDTAICTKDTVTYSNILTFEFHKNATL